MLGTAKGGARRREETKGGERREGEERKGEKGGEQRRGGEEGRGAEEMEGMGGEEGIGEERASANEAIRFSSRSMMQLHKRGLQSHWSQRTQQHPAAQYKSGADGAQGQRGEGREVARQYY